MIGSPRTLKEVLTKIGQFVFSLKIFSNAKYLGLVSSWTVDQGIMSPHYVLTKYQSYYLFSSQFVYSTIK